MAAQANGVSRPRGGGDGRPARAVLLDALGTLVALEPPAPRLRAELAGRGFEVDAATAEAAFSAEIAYYLDHHLEGRDERSLAALRDRCADVIRRTVGLPGLDLATARAAMLASLRFRPHADATPPLRELRARGLKLVVASNWDCSLPEVLSRAGIGALLDGVVSSASVGAAKPDPRPLAAALAVAGTAAEEAVHVGDSEDHDVAAATAAGVRAILLDRRASLAGSAGARLRTDADEAAQGGRAAEVGGAGLTVIRTLAELPSLVLERV